MKNWMPNLIISGTLKPTTSTLNYTLAKHKDIFYGSPSEPKLFGSSYDKGWDWYYISNNPTLKLKHILKNKKKWDWRNLSEHPNITPQDINKNLHLPWEWNNVSYYLSTH